MPAKRGAMAGAEARSAGHPGRDSIPRPARDDGGGRVCSSLASNTMGRMDGQGRGQAQKQHFSAARWSKVGASSTDDRTLLITG